MASFLYRLGRWCARHAWTVLALWLVVLAGVGTGTATLGEPLSNEISIPGSDFEKVLDRLGEEVPEASGGFGTVILHTDEEKFTPEQRKAIREVFAKWKKQDQVKGVISPFESQRSLDRADEKLDKASGQLKKGHKKLQRANDKISKSQGELETGKAWIRLLEKEDPDNPRLPKIKEQVSQGEEKLPEAKKEYREGKRELADSRRQYEAGRAVQRASGDTTFISDGYALAQVQFDRNTQSVDPEVKESIPKIGEQLEDAGVTAEYSVDITQENTLVGPGEVIGLIVAAIVLLIALGTIVAAGLPIAGALLGVGVGLGGAMTLTHFFTMHSMTPALALMLGLAVGIDYALFIVNRHRNELLAGRSLHESVALAVGTAGSAVVVAGTTVAISLIALVVAPVPLLGQMGLVAAGTVAVAVLVALTLTPALLHFVGNRALSRRAWRRAGFTEPGVLREGDHPDEDSDVHGGGYVDAVTRHPKLVALGCVLLCAVIAVPALSLRLGLPDGSSEPAGTTAHTAYVQAAEHFGAGTNGPIIAVAELDRPATKDGAVLLKQADVAQRLNAVEGVDAVIPFGVSKDKETLAFQVVPKEGPADAETVETVRALSASTDAIGSATKSDIGLTGQTVANIEISEELSATLPLYLAIVIGLSLVLLMIVFRSILVPIVATAGFLLSVAASFGATVAVYQWGWLSAVFGVDTPGPVLSFMPIMLIGVLFGLAMDYQMFLVSGMREAHAHGAAARKAVRTGFTHGAKVVLAAALIMTAVFAGFIFADLTMIRSMGFGMAVGVAIDALVIRMTLTPALMHLLGEAAWWMPRWLDRILPNLDVEGTKLTERRAATEASEA